MPGRTTYVDAVEFEPLVGANMHFVFTSGDERLRFAMSRSTVMQAAHEAISVASELREGLVIPFESASGH